jgi:hypothetical protein
VEGKTMKNFWVRSYKGQHFELTIDPRGWWVRPLPRDQRYGWAGPFKSEEELINTVQRGINFALTLRH